MKEEYSSYKFSEDFHRLNGYKPIAYEVMEAIMSFLCFYPLSAFLIYLVNHSKDDLLDGLLLLIPVIAMVYIKRMVQNVALFIVAILAAAAAGTLLLWSEGLRIYHLVFLLAYGVYYVVKRLKNNNLFWRFGNLAAMNIFTAIIYGFTLLNEISLLSNLIFTFAVINLLLSVVYFHFSSTTKLLQWEKYEDEKHARHMKTVNVMFSIMIIIVIGTVIFVVSQGSIFRWLDSLYKHLYSGIFKAMNLATTSQSEFMEMEDEPIFVLPELEGTPGGTSIFFKLIVLFIKLSFVTVIAIDVIVILIALFQKLYKLYLRRLNKDEKVESLITSKDLADNLKRTLKRPGAALRKAVFKTNKEKLRRLYYQAVMSYKKKGVRVEQWNTPYEIETNIGAQHKVKMAEITELYEKYRYTSEEPTEEELKDMKRKINETAKRGR